MTVLAPAEERAAAAAAAQEDSAQVVPTLAPVEMMPDFAWRMARARIDVAQAQLARDCLLQRYSAEDVRGLLVHTTVLSAERRLTYLPAYIFHLTHEGKPYRLFVSGVSGQVGGEKFYSTLSLSSLAGAAAGMASMLVFPEPTVGNRENRREQERTGD